MEFDIVSEETIQDGLATDAYFLRTEEALAEADKNPHVVAEVTGSQLPNGSFRALGGIKDAAALFEGLDVEVDALPEGQLFDGGPVMRIEGPYLEFARFETALLGYLSQASGFLTSAAIARHAAPDTSVVSFGSRHLNPALAIVLERNALIAGMDGFSSVAAGKQLGRDPSGTMPHALIIPFGEGNQEDAWQAFDDGVADEVPRIALTDTFNDETDEARRVADQLGDALDGVRLDTTSSRRGKFDQIIKEVRWTLDRYGHEDVDIFISGGITPDEMEKLRDLVDGFGIGSYISDADPLDFGLDIVEVDGEPIAKRGKFSGKKEIYRTPDGGHDVRLASEDAPSDYTALYEPLIRDGDIVRDFDIDDAATTLANDVARVGVDNIDPT